MDSMLEYVGVSFSYNLLSLDFTSLTKDTITTPTTTIEIKIRNGSLVGPETRNGTVLSQSNGSEPEGTRQLGPVQPSWHWHIFSTVQKPLDIPPQFFGPT